MEGRKNIMRIKFFGTSSGSSRADRSCSCTMLETGGKRYVVDVGMDLNRALKTIGLNYNDVNAVFITHMHGDHADGLLYFLRFVRTAPYDVFLPPPMENTVKAIEGWYGCTYKTAIPENLNFNEISEGVIFDDGNVRVIAYRTRHCEYSYAFVFEAEGKRVLFSGDMSKNPVVDFPYAALDGGLDLAICELGHFPAYVYDEIFKEKAPKKLCINHISEKFIDTAYSYKRESALSVRLAHDGKEMII